MKLTFVINDIQTEKANFTTTRLARRAAERGHEVSLVSIVDFTYEADETVSALAKRPRRTDHDSDQSILDDLQDPGNEAQKVSITEQDVMMLRADPAAREVRQKLPQAAQRRLTRARTMTVDQLFQTTPG